MARRRPERDPGHTGGPNAKEKRHRPKTKNLRAKKGPAATRRAKNSRTQGPGPRRGAATDPSDVPDALVRFVQPYQATKTYLCPGCGRFIPPGLGHMVVIPPDEPDLRRHWHRGCWVAR